MKCDGGGGCTIERGGVPPLGQSHGGVGRGGAGTFYTNFYLHRRSYGNRGCDTKGIDLMPDQLTWLLVRSSVISAELQSSFRYCSFSQSIDSINALKIRQEPCWDRNIPSAEREDCWIRWGYRESRRMSIGLKAEIVLTVAPARPPPGIQVPKRVCYAHPKYGPVHLPRTTSRMASTASFSGPRAASGWPPSSLTTKAKSNSWRSPCPVPWGGCSPHHP